MRRLSLWCTLLLMIVGTLALATAGCGGGSAAGSAGQFGSVTVKVVDDSRLKTQRPIVQVDGSTVVVRAKDILSQSNIVLTVDFYEVVDEVVSDASTWHSEYSLDPDTTSVVADNVPAPKWYELVGRFYSGGSQSPYMYFSGRVQVLPNQVVTAAVTQFMVTPTPTVTATVSPTPSPSPRVSPSPTPSYLPPGNVVELSTLNGEPMGGYPAVAVDPANGKTAIVYSQLPETGLQYYCQLFSGDIDPVAVWPSAKPICSHTDAVVCSIPVTSIPYCGPGVAIDSQGIFICHVDEDPLKIQACHNLAYFDLATGEQTLSQTESIPYSSMPFAINVALAGQASPARLIWETFTQLTAEVLEVSAWREEVEELPPYPTGFPTPQNTFTNYESDNVPVMAANSRGQILQVGMAKDGANRSIEATLGSQKFIVDSGLSSDIAWTRINACMSDNYLAVVWNVDSSVYVRRYSYDSSGNVEPIESTPLLVSTISRNSVSQPAVSIDNVGRAVVVWMDYSNYLSEDGKDFVGVTLNAPGEATILNAPFLISTCTNSENYVGLDVDITNAGRFVVTWETGVCMPTEGVTSSRVFFRNYPIQYGSGSGEDPFVIRGSGTPVDG